MIVAAVTQRYWMISPVIMSPAMGADVDGVTAAGAVSACWPDLAVLLESAEDEQSTIRLRRAESIGRPVGEKAWVSELEAQRGCKLAPVRRGPKRRELSALSP